MFGGELIGIGIILLIGVVLFVIYSVGLKYTYDKGNSFGQSRQAPSSDVAHGSASGVYDAPNR